MSHLIWFSPLTSTLCPFALCCSFLLLKSFFFFFLVWCGGLLGFLWANWLWNVWMHDVWGFHFTRLCASHGPVDPLSCLCKCQNSISPQYATPKSVLWKHSVDLANLVWFNIMRSERCGSFLLIKKADSFVKVINEQQCPIIPRAFTVTRLIKQDGERMSKSHLWWI